MSASNERLILPNNQVFVVVGDVSDHGIAPALYMASARALVHVLMNEGATPTRTLATLNGFLCRDMRPRDFMTLFLGVLDPRTRTLTYASAGHNPPLLRHADGTIESLDRAGPLLGVLEVGEQEAQGVVDLVPDAGRQTSQGLQLLGATQGVLRRLPVVNGAESEGLFV
jgi:serine phosphatase RsbU (regulator of sigma subunit)